MHTFYITAPQERPDFRTVIAFLWRDGQNVDTEGDSHHPASRIWTALYIENRESQDQAVDVNPWQESPLVLTVGSNQQQLAARVAFFLSTYCGGQVSSKPDGEYRSADTLLEFTGAGFSTSEALQRAAQSPFARSSRENPYPNLDQESRCRFWRYIVDSKTQKITVAEAEAKHLVRDPQSGKKPGFVFSRHAWQRLVWQIQGGDELWEYEFRGEEGIGLLREGVVIDHIITNLRRR